MPIKAEVNGDLIELAKAGLFDVIVHGCNCFHTMGAGIAKQIAREFPEALEVDKRTNYGDIKKLGSFITANCGLYDLSVVNMYTQYRYSAIEPEGVDRLVCIQRGFEKLNGSRYYNGLKIGIPMIGAGLAGGKWNEIEEVINEATPHLNIVLVKYKG